MKKMNFLRVPNVRCYENDLDIFNAEIWAREAILALQANMVLGNLVNRNFSPLVAKFGDVVRVPRPASFTTKRKGVLGSNITQEDATADYAQVPLDQLLYVSFQINDGEEDRAAHDLVNLLLLPAVQSLATKVDLILSGQQMQLWDNVTGHLGGISSSTIRDYIIATDESMNITEVPQQGRKLILSPQAKSAALGLDLFAAVNQSGTSDALRNAVIGRAFGFDTYMAQHQPNVATGQTSITNAVNNTGGYAAGTTTLTIDGAGLQLVGAWCVIAGDDTPQHITAQTGTTASTAITISPGLRRAVADNAVVTTITPGAVNGTGFNGPTTHPTRPGFATKIITDGWTSAPQVGQTVTFGTTNTKYSIVGVSTTGDDGSALSANNYGLTLDHPLEASIADNDKVNLGPAGSYNLAFTQDAFALVNRPLPKPRTGAMSSVINYGGLSMRVTITYDGIKQAHIVTIDFLMGVGILNPSLAAVMLG